MSPKRDDWLVSIKPVFFYLSTFIIKLIRSRGQRSASPGRPRAPRDLRPPTEAPCQRASVVRPASRFPQIDGHSAAVEPMGTSGEVASGHRRRSQVPPGMGPRRSRGHAVHTLGASPSECLDASAGRLWRITLNFEPLGARHHSASLRTTCRTPTNVALQGNRPSCTGARKRGQKPRAKAGPQRRARGSARPKRLHSAALGL